MLDPYDLCDLHLHRRLTELVRGLWRLSWKDGPNGDGWMLLVSLKDATSGLGRNKTNKPTPSLTSDSSFSSSFLFLSSTRTAPHDPHGPSPLAHHKRPLVHFLPVSPIFPCRPLRCKTPSAEMVLGLMEIPSREWSPHVWDGDGGTGICTTPAPWKIDLQLLLFG